MNQFYAGSVGIAAAVLGTLADVNEAPAAEIPNEEPGIQPAASTVASDVLDVPKLDAGAMDGAAAKEKCDGKCQVLALTEQALPGLGATHVVGLLLYPEERGLKIDMGGGSTALTVTVLPTKIARGQGLVAIRRF